MEVSPPPPPLGGAVEGNNSLGGKETEGEESENGPAGRCKHTQTHTLNLNTPMPVLDGLETKFPKKTTLPPVDKGLEQHKLTVFFFFWTCLSHAFVMCKVEQIGNKHGVNKGSITWKNTDGITPANRHVAPSLRAAGSISHGGVRDY